LHRNAFMLFFPADGMPVATNEYKSMIEKPSCGTVTITVYFFPNRHACFHKKGSLFIMIIGPS